MLKCIIIFISSSTVGDLSESGWSSSSLRSCFCHLWKIKITVSSAKLYFSSKSSFDLTASNNDFPLVKMFLRKITMSWVICREISCDRKSIIFFWPREKKAKLPSRSEILIFKSCFLGRWRNYQINKRDIFQDLRGTFLKRYLLFNISRPNKKK